MSESTLHLSNKGRANATPRNSPEPPPVPNCRWIPLQSGQWALVDECDYSEVMRRTWYARRCSRSIYAASATGLRGEKVYLHRLLMNAPPGYEVDHKNGNGLDCRRENLRLCTAGENRRNMRKTAIPKTSQYKGVCYDPGRRKWRATIKLNREWKYLGRYDSEEDAAHAFDRAAKELFGEFARLNFPEAA